jgi:tetratricopeptide (TPR) repeat protein
MIKKNFLIFILIFFSLYSFGQIEKRFFKYGKSKYLESDYEKALEYFDATIELNPKFDSAYYYRGLVKKSISIKRNDWTYLDSAMKDFSISIRFNPNFSESYFQKGILNPLKKQWDGNPIQVVPTTTSTLPHACSENSKDMAPSTQAVSRDHEK